MFRRGGGVKTMDGVMHGIETRSMNNLGGRIGYAFGTEQLVQGDTPQTLGPVTHGKGISNIDTGNFDLSNSAEYTQMYPSDGGIDIDIDLRQIAKVAQSVGISYKQLLAMTKQVSQQYGLGLKAALKVIMNQLAEGDVSLLDQLEGDQGANVEEFGSSDLVPFNDRSGINTVRNGKEDVPEELTALVQGVRPGKQEGGLMNLSGRIGFAEKGTTNPEITDLTDSINLIDQVGGPAPDHLAQLLISGGLNLVSGVGAGTGSKLGDIAAAYKDPTAQAFKGMAADRTSKRSLAASLLKGKDTKGFNKFLIIADQMIKNKAPGIEGLSRVELATKLWKQANETRQSMSDADKDFKEKTRQLEILQDDKDIQGNPRLNGPEINRFYAAREKLKKDYPEQYKNLGHNQYISPKDSTDLQRAPESGIITVSEDLDGLYNNGDLIYDFDTNAWYTYDKSKLQFTLAFE